MPKVLIVDDNPNYIEELASCFSRKHITTMGASNAVQALLTGFAFQPDLLISDWKLNHEIDGVKLGEILGIASQNLKVIIISGYAPTTSVYNNRPAWLHDFLLKPFSLEQILSAVTQSLQSPPVKHVHAPDLGILQLSAEDNVLYANNCSRKMFARAGLNLEMDRPLDDATLVKRINSSASQATWSEYQAIGPNKSLWHGFSTALFGENFRYLFLLEKYNVHLKLMPCVSQITAALQAPIDNDASPDFNKIVTDDSILPRQGTVEL